MTSPVSTTLVIVGDAAPAVIRPLARLANVRATTIDRGDDASAARWERAGTSPYLVHDHDPLAHVAAAWAEFFDDEATLETLTLEIDRAIDALDRGAASIPDYYVVLEPEALPATVKHWWLGVMASASPSRVIPWTDPSASLRGLLRRLPTGRPWPAHAEWLGRLPSAIPDRVGITPPAA